MFWLGYAAEGGLGWGHEGSDGWSGQDGGRGRSRKSRPRGAEQCHHLLQFPHTCGLVLTDKVTPHLLLLLYSFPFY